MMPNEIASQGMSRAAKKRAKRKQRQNDPVVSAKDSPTPRNADDADQKAAKRPRSSGSILKTSKYSVVKSKKEDPNASDVAALSMKEEYDAESIEVPTEVSRLMDLLLLNEQQLVNMAESSPLLSATARQRARMALAFLLQPSNVSVMEFYDRYWEQKPLLVQHSISDVAYRHRLDGFLSIDGIRTMLDKLYYGRDVNVTRYQQDNDDWRRVTLDATGVAVDDDPHNRQNFVKVDAEKTWQQYEQQGCTLRLLCPQEHCDSVHHLLSLLELEFGCMVGANAYLTPAGPAQGFAPHYDDIEAFCLQLQGQKRWRVYAPLRHTEVLPRVSSDDCKASALASVAPVLDVVLSPGDVLYMPRGWIHQAVTVPDSPSLHMTVSAMQQWAWADLLDICIPEALHQAIAAPRSALRNGLPRNFLHYMGAMHDHSSQPEVLLRDNDEPDEEEMRQARAVQHQSAFRVEAKAHIMRVAQQAMELVDAACDELGKRFLSDRLPPALTVLEQTETSHEPNDTKEIGPATLVRLVRPGIARLVLEDNQAIMYHCGHNSRVHHETPLSPLEFELDDGPALEQLLTTVESSWIAVSELIHDSIDDKVGVAQALYEEGILSIRNE